MSKFKIGDRVRVVNNEGWPALPIGHTGTITREKAHYEGAMPFIQWDTPLMPGSTYTGPTGILEKRLELIPPLTDEELAAKYRQLRAEAYDTNDELRRRGYIVQTIGGVPITTSYGVDCKIFKYVEEDVLVKQSVRKEL